MIDTSLSVLIFMQCIVLFNVIQLKYAGSVLHHKGTHFFKKMKMKTVSFDCVYIYVGQTVLEALLLVVILSSNLKKRSNEKVFLQSLHIAHD